MFSIQIFKNTAKDTEGEYFGQMTKYLDKLKIGELILVDPLTNELHNKEVPEYLGDGEFKIPDFVGYTARIDNVCLISYNHGPSIVPLFSLAQALLLGDLANDLKSIKLVQYDISTRSNEEESKEESTTNSTLAPKEETV